MKVWKLIALTVASMIVVPQPLASQAVLFDPVTGYRLTQYRGVVDRVPEGVSRLDVQQAIARHGSAIFIDVTPAEGAARDANGGWHLATPHATIPGAHWFPEAGRGILAPGIAPWFNRGVSRLTKGRHNRPIVVFCLADCWMSWNAALRLRRAGYTDVGWFADGIDGWKEGGRRTFKVAPES